MFKLDQLGAGEVVTELLDIFDLCSAPAVDRLVVVAHDHQVAAAPCEYLQPSVLDRVGVLKLVHKNVLEAALIVVEYLRILEPELV